MLTLDYEQYFWHQKYKFIVGIDEVGRGSVAGPLVVGAVMFDSTSENLKGVDDSKKLTPHKRHKLAALIKESAIQTGIGEISAHEIDKIGLSKALHLASIQALSNFPTVEVVLIDGPNSLGLDELFSNVIPIVKGDGKVYTIASASIIAKVYRDFIMHQHAPTYPNYHFESNVGYGTKQHLNAIHNHGLTPLHRRSFLTKYLI